MKYLPPLLCNVVDEDVLQILRAYLKSREVVMPAVDGRIRFITPVRNAPESSPKSAISRQRGSDIAPNTYCLRMLFIVSGSATL